MSICTLVYPRPLCTLCTWRLLSFKEVHLYLGVPSSLLYLVYLETFLLCRCPSVHWCTLVPYVPCVPGDFCPLNMSICTLVYPRPLCTLCTWRLLSFKEVHLYLGVPSSLLYLVYLETFLLCRCPSVHWCTLVPYVPCVPGDFCPLNMSICTLVYPRPLCTLCTWRLLSFKDVHLYLGVPSSLLYPVYLETFVLYRCPSVHWCTLVHSVPCVPGDFCPLKMSICTLVYPRPLCTLCTWSLLSFADVHL